MKETKFDEEYARLEILQNAKDFYKEKNSGKKFIAGETYIPAAGKMLDEDDLSNLIK